jgi:hypothetical protein
MVDAPPARNFIVVVTFLGFYALLLGLMPPVLLGEGNEFTGKQAVYSEEYWSISDLQELATFHNITPSNGGAYYSEAWGIDEDFGHHFLFKSNVVDDEIKIANEHYYVFFVGVDIPYGHHEMSWTAKANGQEFDNFLNQTEFDLVAETSDDNITAAAFDVECDHVKMHAVVGFNYTLYANATDAYENDALSIEFGIDWDELGTGLNAWNMLSRILFFQAPDIDPLINAVIAVPLWAAIGYLSYAIVLVAIDILPF